MEFTLPINPVACPRPRVSRFRTYYPPKYVKWRKEAENLLRSVVDIQTNDAICDVVMEFNYAVPKSYTKKQRQAALNGDKLPREDVDNLAKGIGDLLTHCGVWKDDTQMRSLCVWKQYAEEDSIVVRITWKE